MIEISSPLRLRLCSDSLVHNWRWLKKRSGATCGAVIKADGYGLGAREVMALLTEAGCRDFFVATWEEVLALMPLSPGVGLSVLHGVRAQDMAAARLLPMAVRPVLNSREQVQRWRGMGENRPCDIMADTGINRLGLSAQDIASGIADGLCAETLMSHLACADEDNAMNVRQLERFTALTAMVSARRYSLANSAAICLGRAYSFDLTRPGLALYGGIPRQEAKDYIKQVVTLEAQIIQRRMVTEGETVGYGATWTAKHDTAVAIVNLGYADGYLKFFQGVGSAKSAKSPPQSGDNAQLPLIGRVSMDLAAFDANSAPNAREGEWLTIDYDLPQVSAATGLSQYELLTGLGKRFASRFVPFAARVPLAPLAPLAPCVAR